MKQLKQHTQGTPTPPKRFAPHPPKLDAGGSRAVFEWTGRKLSFQYENRLWLDVEVGHAEEEAKAWGPNLIAMLREMGLKCAGNPVNALRKVFEELLSLRAEATRLRGELAAERASKAVLAGPTIRTATYEGTEVVSRTTGVVLRFPKSEKP